jgi:hypothetical protein
MLHGAVKRKRWTPVGDTRAEAVLAEGSRIVAPAGAQLAAVREVVRILACGDGRREWEAVMMMVRGTFAGVGPSDTGAVVGRWAAGRTAEGRPSLQWSLVVKVDGVDLGSRWSAL